MRFSVMGLAIAGGLLWGGGILLVGLINLARPEYGVHFLQMMSSVYPWFHASRSIGDVVIGTVDGLVDGAIAGALLAWLYNLVSKG
jgi:predicted DNA repair protein MutK